MDRKRREPLPLDGDIALERFVALSYGIGLGEPRPRQLREAPPPARFAARGSAGGGAASGVAGVLGSAGALGVAAGAAGSADFATSGAAVQLPPSFASAVDTPVTVAAASGKRGALARRVLAHAIDFAIVGVTLVTGVLAAATWRAAATGADPIADWYTLAPMQWLAGFETLQILAGVYGLFFAYVLLFKLVAGRTFGEILLRQRRPPTLVREAQRARSLVARGK